MGSSDITPDKRPSRPAEPPRDAATDAETRPIHYLFAHYALRSVALNDPVFYFNALASPDARKFLTNLLQTTADHARPGDPPADFTADDLTVHTVRAGAYPCAVVEMPQPQAMTEAYFTAAVLLVDAADESPHLVGAPVRYFTLEKSFDLDGNAIAMMCEWGKDGSHANFGGGPPPRLDDFVKAVEHLLKNQAPRGGVNFAPKGTT
jgi:hypothetical protein